MPGPPEEPFRPGSDHSTGELPPGNTILIVEDEEMILDINADYLGDVGFVVLTADSQEAALQLFGDYAEDIDLIVLDYSMPGQPADRFLARLRKRRGDIPAIICSGLDIDSVQPILTEHDTFLPKPFLPTQLAEKISEMLKV